jgi:hypothetical protein
MTMDHRKFSNVNPDAPSQRPPVPAAPQRRSLWGEPIGYVVAYGPNTYGQQLLTHEEAEARAKLCGGTARVELVCVAPVRKSAADKAARPAAPLTRERIAALAAEAIGNPLIAEDLLGDFPVHTEMDDWEKFAALVQQATGCSNG